ncbi:hypothetical protein O6H91_01G107400 [Diphasiastrum complanatum]|uniref:Uncharacterized protein n=1 Tax=Diphasiastrum complanatum TaxID=34168 RepID=A0ACC2EUQ0_DIPCM|nr:hypothetical protein O6H91_01G107400 [Diphasiastrum complanatum]
MARERERENMAVRIFPSALEESVRVSLQRASDFLANPFQAVQTSVTGAATKLSFLLTKQVQKVDSTFLESQSEVLKSAQGISNTNVTEQLDPWKKNSTWVDEPPSIQITVPKGSLCKLDCTFKIGIPPDAVFNIITDPDNKRVFKNIERLTYHRVLRDEGNRQLVEVEQEAIWKFLWLTGTFTVHVLVDQDRNTHTMKFELAKEGFMKRFEGSWNLEPLFVDLTNHSSNSSLVLGAQSGRVASVVKLQQIVQPSLIPPPPLSWYIRAITARTIELMIQDLQAEGKSIREGQLEEINRPNKEAPESKPLEATISHLLKMKRQSRRKANWFNKKRSRWDIGRTIY